MYLRRANERGVSSFHGDGVVSYHTFSFADYWDKNHVGFSVLKVFNDDLVASRKGFDSHHHRDVEILFYIAQGEIDIQHTLGKVEHLQAGDALLLSAGSGLEVSSVNPASSKAHVYMMWFEPYLKGLKPSVQHIDNPPHEGLKLLAGPVALNGNSLKINQKVQVFYGHHARDGETVYRIAKGRKVWLHIVKGEALMSENPWWDDALHLREGDGVGLNESHEKLHIQAEHALEFFLIDVPA